MPEKKASQEDYKKWYEENMERLRNKYKTCYPNPNMHKEWEGFTQAPFPPAAKGLVVDGIDLVLIHSTVVRCIRTYYEGGLSIESMEYGALEDSVQDLKRIVPLLVGDTAEYFGRLLEFGWAFLEEVPD